MADLFFNLISGVLNFLILVFTLRILLAMTNASANNPITQSIIKISKPFRSLLLFIPNLGKFEVSSFIIMFICFFLHDFYFESSILGIDIILASFKNSIIFLLTALWIIFIILAISSWFVPSPQSNRNPALDIIYQISNPILFFIKKLIPTSVGVIDFSVIIALFLIHFIRNFIDIIL